MPGERRPGMDHGHYGFSPLPARPPLRWPRGARVALWVVLYLEYWELDAPAGAYRAPGVHGHWGMHFPDYRTYSYREYGNRVGIFRVLEVLDRHRVPVTVAANAAAYERYPFLVAECLRRDWEIAAHGTHATRMITSRMTEAEEREAIRMSVEAVARASGRPPRGWIGQDFGDAMEWAFRQSLMLSHGSFAIFVTRPLALGLLLATGLVGLSPLVGAVRRSREVARSAAG